MAVKSVIIIDLRNLLREGCTRPTSLTSIRISSTEVRLRNTIGRKIQTSLVEITDVREVGFLLTCTLVGFVVLTPKCKTRLEKLTRGEKRSSLFGFVVGDREKSFYHFATSNRRCKAEISHEVSVHEGETGQLVGEGLAEAAVAAAADLSKVVSQSRTCSRTLPARPRFPAVLIRGTIRRRLRQGRLRRTEPQVRLEGTRRLRDRSECPGTPEAERTRSTTPATGATTSPPPTTGTTRNTRDRLLIPKSSQHVRALVLVRPSRPRPQR
jgi:hypothetical protein